MLNIREVLHVGDNVTLRILKIDDEQHRIGLSMRRVDSAAYADQDWKSLVADFDMGTGDSEGETLATHLGQEIPAEENTSVEEAPAPEENPVESDPQDEAAAQNLNLLRSQNLKQLPKNQRPRKHRLKLKLQSLQLKMQKLTKKKLHSYF